MSKKKIIILTAAAVMVLALVTAACVFLFSKPKKIMPKETVKLSAFTENTDGIRLIAHRGLSGVAPENTLPAFELAGENGFFGIECDVYMTADGRWVIMHDGDTKRMCGKRKIISLSSYETLSFLEITNGANIEQYPNTKIPTVEEYLEICVKRGAVPVVEIKNGDCSEKTIKNLYDVVYSVDGVKDVIFISFKKQALESIRKCDENAVCYLLVLDMKNEDVDWCRDNGFGINFNAESKKLEDETVEYAVSSGIDTACWTVDRKDTLNKMLSFGIYTFTTNRILPEE